MTRSSLRRTLRRAYWILGIVLVVSIVAKLADHIPGLAGSAAERLLKDIYDYLKDMSLVLVTVVAAYLANVFQKRSLFLNALKEEWRNIVKAKSAVFTYTQLEKPSQEQYLAAFCAISECVDNMRAVYSNVGETQKLIGLYPYAPLHDIRRALQTLKPTPARIATADERDLARRRDPAVVLRVTRDVPRGNRLGGAGQSAADLQRPPAQEVRCARVGQPQRGTPSKEIRPGIAGRSAHRSFPDQAHRIEHATPKPRREVASKANGAASRAARAWDSAGERETARRWREPSAGRSRHHQRVGDE